MILGKHKLFILILVFFFITSAILFAADKIKSVPLINLEDLPPTFEEDKDELEKNDVNISNLKKDKTTPERKRSKKSEKVDRTG